MGTIHPRCLLLSSECVRTSRGIEGLSASDSEKIKSRWLYVPLWQRTGQHSRHSRVFCFRETLEYVLTQRTGRLLKYFPWDILWRANHRLQAVAVNTFCQGHRLRTLFPNTHCRAWLAFAHLNNFTLAHNIAPDPRKKAKVARALDETCIASKNITESERLRGLWVFFSNNTLFLKPRTCDP